MPLIIVFFFFTVIAVATAALLNCKLAESYPLCGFMLIFFGFLLGILRLLNLYIIFAAAAFVLSAVYLIYIIIKKQKLPWQEMALIALIFGVLLTLMWILCRGRRFEDWDDFSHWGTAVKIMFTNNSFDVAKSSIDGFRAYPPATAVFQYLLMKLCMSGYREDIALFANQTLIVLCSLLVLRGFNVKKSVVSSFASTLALAFIPMFVFPRSGFRLGVDVLLGVLTATVILSELLISNTRASRLICASCCAVLTLTKSSGFGLAVFLGAAILLRALFVEKQRALKPILLSASGLFCAIAANLLWSIHCSVIGITDKWKADEAIVTATREQRADITASFFNKLSEPNYVGMLGTVSFLAMILVCVLFFAAAYLSANKENKPRILKTAIVGVSVIVLFTLSLLISYLFVFDAGEGLALASVLRYLNTAVVFGLYLSFASLASALCVQKWYCRIGVLSIWAAIILLTHYDEILYYIKNSSTIAAQSQHNMYFPQNAAQTISKLGEQPRVYVITGNDAGEFDLKLKYELYPIVLPKYNSILRAENNNLLPWEHNISLDELTAHLANDFDYVYIYNYEQTFLEDYGSLFENINDAQYVSLYEIVTGSDNDAKLRLINN